MEKKEKSYAQKKLSKPIPINDGLDHEVTEEQKRVNLKAIRRMRGRGD